MAISLLLAYWGQVDMVATLQTSHHHLLFPWLCYFSSAAHIDCILLSVTIFPNLIDSFDLYLIFATFGLNVHNNIAPKPVQLLWGFLRLNFNYQKRSKLGFFGGFWAIFATVFNLRQCNLVHMHIRVLTGVCKVWHQEPYFGALFDPE